MGDINLIGWVGLDEADAGGLIMPATIDAVAVWIEPDSRLPVSDITLIAPAS